MAKKICIINNKGGVGKTTVCFQLSGFLAMKKKRVLCVDFDPQGSLSRAFSTPAASDVDRNLYYAIDVAKTAHKSKDKPSLNDYICHPYPNEKELSNIDLIQADYGMTYQEFEINDLYELLLTIDESKYDYILFDTHPQIDSFATTALMYCDYMIGVLDESNDSFVNMNHIFEDILSSLHERNYKVLILGVLLNICNTQTLVHKNNKKILSKAYGDILFKTMISESVKVKESAMFHVPLSACFDKAKPKIYNQFYSLTKEVINRCEGDRNA